MAGRSVSEMPASRLRRYWSSIRRQPLPVLLHKLRHPFVWPIDLGPPERILERSAATYDDPREVAYASQLAGQGLSEAEETLILGWMKAPARILTVGCGAGREAIALARLGCAVVGIDIAQRMVKAAQQLAAQEGLSVQFLTRAAHQVSPEELGVFDCILATNGLYSLIPTRALRIHSLRALASVLTPSGVMFLGAICPARYRPGPRVELVDWLRRLRRLVGNHVGTAEPGDRLEAAASHTSDARHPVFVHVFLHPRDVDEELRRAGLAGRRIHEDVWDVRRASESSSRPSA